MELCNFNLPDTVVNATDIIVYSDHLLNTKILKNRFGLTGRVKIDFSKPTPYLNKDLQYDHSTVQPVAVSTPIMATTKRGFIHWCKLMGYPGVDSSTEKLALIFHSDQFKQHQQRELEYDAMAKNVK